MQPNHFQKILILFAWVITVLGLAMSVVLMIQIIQDTRQKKAAAYEYASQQAALLHSEINGEMQAEMRLAKSYAKRISDGELSYEQATTMITVAFNEKPGLQGIAVAFEPYIYDSKTKLYAPYYIKDGTGQIKRVQVEEIYDYTDSAIASGQWYYKAIAEKDGVWRGAYYGQAADDLLIVYSTPFQSPENQDKNVGVIVVAHSATDTFKRLMQAIDLGQGGYAFLVNSQNQVSYHPEVDLLGANVADFADRLGGMVLLEAIKTTASGNAANFSAPIGNKGDKGWYFVHPLSVPGWNLVIVVNEKLSTYDAASVIRPQINIGLVSLLFLSGLLMLIFRVDRVTPVRLMIFSVILGCLFTGEILWVWYLVYNNPELNHEKVIVNYSDIQRLLEPMEARLQSVNAGKPIQIPTGIVVENLSITSQSAKVSGYIWQRYPADTPAEMIDFPQFTDQVGGISRRETYRISKNGMIVVGWFFSTEIQQQFDVTRYPLDQTFVRIELEPARLSDKYVLVPDIREYSYMGSAYKPGLSDKLWVRGWHVTNSYFSYEQVTYGTQLGIYQKIQKDAIPILNFNIRLNRDIISPVIAYCVVIYVVIIQVYGLAILQVDNAFQVLSIAAALFLVSAISHNAMRDTLGATGIVYLEYFFIVLYITILFTTINAITRVMNIKTSLLTYRDNLLIKVLFWPAYLGIGLIITLLNFYPF